MFDDQLPRLEGLFALSRARGLDVRPTLLRVLTDLFVEARQPSESDIERYSELAGHLVDQVDDDTRLVVARKLGPCPFAPRLIIDKLIASEPEAAERVIATSPLLTRDDLWTLATDGGPMTSAAIARRRDIDQDLARFLARKGYPLVADALADNVAVSLDEETILLLSPAAADLPDLASRLSRRRDVQAPWLAPLFLDLERSSRMAVLAGSKAESHALRPRTRESQISAPQLVLDAIEHAALSRNPADVGIGLADLLDLDGAIAARIVSDASGEPLAVTLAAIGMPVDQAARVLIFTAPATPDDAVERIRRLVQIVETVPRMAATRLVRAFTLTSIRQVHARHEMLFAEPGQARSKAPARRREQGVPVQANKAARPDS